MRHTFMKRIIAAILALILMLAVTGIAEAVSDTDLWNQAVATDEMVDTSSLNENGWWNVLLLGCDSYTKNKYSRSDSMIIVSINLETKQVKMSSLMRDIWIRANSSADYHKLTELCALGGPSRVMEAIKNNFGIDIKDYALISMKGVATIIDMVGGVDMDVTEAERKALNKGLFDLSTAENTGHMTKLAESGENVHLNGNQATAYARIRKIDSDFIRTNRQRTVLIKIADAIKQNANPATLLSIVQSLSSFVETNLNFSQIMSIASMGLSMDLSTVEELRIPYDGTYKSGNFDGVYSIRPNYDKNRKILKAFIYG